YFFIVTAPVFLFVRIYTILSMLINHVGRKYSPFIGLKWVLASFITNDIIYT
ncbi:hypothetical protein BGZ57DRAFT_708463, partial [Hyaloscypha finlandica]